MYFFLSFYLVEKQNHLFLDISFSLHKPTLNLLDHNKVSMETMKIFRCSIRKFFVLFLCITLNLSVFVTANSEASLTPRIFKQLPSVQRSQFHKQLHPKWVKPSSKGNSIREGKQCVDSFLHHKAGYESSSSIELANKDAQSTANGGVESYSSAVKKTVLAVGAAIAFGCGVWMYRGKKAALEFFAGYLIEESLSIDNIFVFIMLFDYFKVPTNFQSRAFTWGIIGALVMRGGMILLGVKAIQRFQWVTLGFAGILIASSVKILMESE